jgi:hypothetical protein
MFGRRFFGARFFGATYYGDGGTVVVSADGTFFGPRFFGGNYFGARFFGTAPGSTSGYPNIPLTNVQMQQLFAWVNDLALVHGLVSGSDLVVTPTTRSAGTVVQTIGTVGSTVTVSR